MSADDKSRRVSSPQKCRYWQEHLEQLAIKRPESSKRLPSERSRAAPVLEKDLSRDRTDADVSFVSVQLAAYLPAPVNGHYVETGGVLPSRIHN